jgi:membrane fusion protein (multidrug efflux system)
VQHLEGNAAIERATIRRLDHEIEQRLLRAPIDGRIAEAEPLRPGAVLEVGARVASIVPDGTLRVVAQFEPAAALGRVRLGQQARLRLQGFPWIEYGSLPAVVTNVADDVRDGQVRVELAIEQAPSRVPIQHGLPGSVEIEVERVRPFWLVFRTLGGLLTRPTAASTTTESPASR